MGSPGQHGAARSHYDFPQTSRNYVEVAAMMMPKPMTGIKHMLRPACKHLPMPMSMGWQENPVDDDYPQRLLIPGLQLSDIDSGATRPVVAPWMHALYSMTHDNQPSGVTEIKLEDAHFAKSFTWQHKAVLCVLCFQGMLGLLAFARSQLREGTLILFGILLQILEGYCTWKYPTRRPPRAVAKPRYYVLHKGMASTHFLLISHRPSNISTSVGKPYTNLEDVAVPLPVVRKGYCRLQEVFLRKLLQFANMGLKMGAVLTPTDSLIFPFTLLIGTVASEIIISLHTPLPRYSEMEPLDTADPKHSSTLDMLAAISQKTGCVSVGFVESILPDPAGNHVDYDWIEKVLRTKKGMFYQASKISLPGAVFIGGRDNTTVNINGGDEFMAKLLQETIPSTAFDSSARDPPPRCHPGTRLAILERCVAFIVNCTGKRKMRWVFGAAGVGKSAVMQSVAEHPIASVPIRASIFFFVNGRSDGSKAIVTLAYQLAVQCEPYRQFIKQEIELDPSLLQKSMSVQFNKFIVEPFIHSRLNSIGRVSIIIDGLDECDKKSTQRELLRLISDFCLTYPSSPIVWMIASRPEHHITSFFAQASVGAAYEKEEIPVDSDNAWEDVERFLREQLITIQDGFSLHLQAQAQWPSEEDIWKLADASGGLFAFAQTVVKYIGDHNIGDPTRQLKGVLRVIDAHPLRNASHKEHPMALLDALYSRILSEVPTKVMGTVRKLLLALVIDWEQLCDKRGRDIVVLGNWLGISRDEAYAAIRHLSSVLYVSGDGEADLKQLRYFHKSFLDYLIDFSRSGFSPDIKRDAYRLFIQCTNRILAQAPDGIDVGDLNYNVAEVFGGRIVLMRGPGTGDNISLAWPVEEGNDWREKLIRLYMYKLAFASIMYGLWRGERAACNVFFLRLMAARLDLFSRRVAQVLSFVVFNQSHCQEFMEQGLLLRIPIKVLITELILFPPRLHFHCPTTQNSNLSDPWNSACTHTRHGLYGRWGEGRSSWSTDLSLDLEGQSKCEFCYRRFESQLESWKAQNPDYPVLVLFTSAGIGIVEFRFVDLEDGISEWTYNFCHKFLKEEHKRLGSTL